MFGLVDTAAGDPEISSRLVNAARHQYAMRRRCDAMIGKFFGEPAWDILLDLFIAHAEGRRTPVKNLCLAACASTSTATRRLDFLIASGLVHKADDTIDARRSLVELTERGRDVMALVLQAGV